MSIILLVHLYLSLYIPQRTRKHCRHLLKLCAAHTEKQVEDVYLEYNF
jgi:hypothetical protein